MAISGADNIFVADWTKNIGTTDSATATVTRYYLSETPSIDPDTAFVLHERSVPPLASGQEDQYNFVQIPWPSQFPPGTYYFAACTDANDGVVEMNEINNCSYHDVEQINYKISVGDSGAINSPPDCSAAAPSKETLWPPNHKFQKVKILGVTDLDQDEVTISVTAITQDEAVNSESSGNTSPDGKGIGLPFAQLRSERDGTGDGRVYTIYFEASDSAGNQCTGSVSVTSVVHDQSSGSSIVIDSGQIYDSTQEF